ncbi:WD40/YVTN/BNR-like repeat-containing protein [Lactovum odontotermitis]
MKSKIVFSIVAAFLVLAMIAAGIFVFTRPRFLDVQEAQISKDNAAIAKEKVSTPDLKTSERYDYFQQPASDKLYVTSNYGKTWKTVPVALSDIRGGDYSAIPEYELMPGSYFLSKNLLAFIYSDRTEVLTDDGQDSVHSDKAHDSAMFVSSRDSGKSWQKSKISENMNGMRFRQIDLLADGTLVVTLTGGRVVAQEGGSVYQSIDAGLSWTVTGHLPASNLLQSVSWIDKSQGFFGYKGALYVTADAGASSQECQINLPAEYHTEYGDIFTTPERVTKSGGNFILTMNQGDTGDYKGGKVLAELISTDGGLTFNFEKEVAP